MKFFKIHNDKEENIENKCKKLFLKVEDKLRFEYKDLKLIGFGDHGCAFLTNENSVLKLTDDKYEYKMALALLNNKYPNLLHRFPEIYNLKNFKNKIFIIEMEYAKILKNKNKKLYEKTENFIYDNIISKGIDLSSINKKDIKSKININKYKYFDEIFNLYKDFDEIFNLYKDFHKENLFPDDLQAQNVGWNSNGDLIVIDLGNII